MARRHVTASGKDRDGDITSLCNRSDWGVRLKADAIRDIETRTHSYYTGAGSYTADVYVVQGSKGKYLTTSRDGTTRNNLDDLPNC